MGPIRLFLTAAGFEGGYTVLKLCRRLVTGCAWLHPAECDLVYTCLVYTNIVHQPCLVYTH
jgi:hypothetical protein